MSLSRLQRALNVLKAPLRSYNEVAQRYPFETGVVTTVVKTSAADLFAQKVCGRGGRAGMNWPPGKCPRMQLGTSWLHSSCTIAWMPGLC